VPLPPVPAQTLTRVQATRDIIADCGRQLRRTATRLSQLPVPEDRETLLGPDMITSFSRPSLTLAWG
jgi:hypothetical protein